MDVKLTLDDELKTDVGDLPNVDLALASAVANRPEVQAQAKRIKSAELSYSSTTGERLPSLVAQGDYGLIGNRMHNTLDTYNMAVLLQVPIFDGAQREGRIREARSVLQQEGLKLQGIINQVKMEVREALVTIQSAKEQVAISQGGMKAALRELQFARERFAVLTANSNLEVTNALYSVSRARDNIVEALFRLNAARIHLVRAQGQLDMLY
jgi:outer membrane protein